VIRQHVRSFGLALVVGLVMTSVTGAGAAPGSLIAAVRAGDIAAVRALVGQTGRDPRPSTPLRAGNGGDVRAAVNAVEPDGTTPLHLAVRAGDVEMAQLLLRAGANSNAANRYGVTALQLAAVNGDPAMLTLLLKAGANVGAVLPEGETILMTAARTGRPEALQVVLDAGAVVSAHEKWYGETALHWAAAENHADAVRLLIARGAQVDERSAAMNYPRRRAGQSILSLGSWTPLMYAARENAIDVGRVLISSHAGLDLVDPDGATALEIAIVNANYDFAAMLIDAGAGTNVVDSEAGMGPLYAAIDMHRLAVGHGRPNPKPSGLLDSVDIVKRLLAKGADPNATLKAPILQRHHTGGDATLGAGATPLMRAAKSGDIEIVEWLLAAGADPRATLPNGTNALMLAAGLGWRNGSPLAPSYDQGPPDEAVRTIAVLMERGLDLDTANDAGDTALHAAVSGRRAPEIVRYLVERGANPNVQNKRGQTPLAAAARVESDSGVITRILQGAPTR
jgi:ankyrin repeat protein